uniref:Transposase n=1 Tax=Heterorhabditis bacteriophora TaxID=37862 RepID=A0A1I7X653_HETBA
MLNTEDQSSAIEQKIATEKTIESKPNFNERFRKLHQMRARILTYEILEKQGIAFI